MTPSTYQSGSLIRRKRSRLPDVWEFRYRQYTLDNSSTYVREVLGTVEEYPTRKSVMTKVEEIRARINTEPKGVFFRDVAKRYKDEVLPQLRPRTQSTNLGTLRHLENQYNDRRIGTITPGELDSFLNTLKSHGRKGKGGVLQGVGRELSKTTRQHVKALAHHVWRQAMLWGYLKLETNPVQITRITHGARARVRSVIVDPDVYGRLLADPELPLLVKTMVRVAMITGMRVSEILGLKWSDIDFENLVMHVQRSSVGKHIADTKNPSSENDVPIHRSLAIALKEWKKAEPVYDGWVFGSPVTNRPYHEMNLQQKHLRPAGARAGITNLGWHSFRHTHSADLEIAGASDRVQQASMRHTDAAMTKKYGRHSPALLKKVREAQNKVVRMLPTGTKG